MHPDPGHPDTGAEHWTHRPVEGRARLVLTAMTVAVFLAVGLAFAAFVPALLAAATGEAEVAPSPVELLGEN